MLFPVTYWKSTGWTPAQLSPLVWTAPRLAVTESSGNVSDLPDVSGNGNDLTQLVGSSQPTYNSSNVDFNGIATVDFNGTSDFLRNSALSSSMTNCTIFLVYRVNSATLEGDQVFGTETTNAKRFIYGPSVYDGGAINNGSGWKTLIVSGNEIVMGQTAILMIQFDSTTLRIKIDNNAIYTYASAIPTSTTSQISIGYSIGLNARWLNMDFAELIVINSAISSDDINLTHDYLNEVYSIW